MSRPQLWFGVVSSCDGGVGLNYLDDDAVGMSMLL